MDLVCCCFPNNLKGSDGAKSDKGIRRRVMGSVILPGNWQNFLKVDANKVELFIFLSQQFGDTFIESGKELVAALGEKVLAAPLRMDLSSIVRCNYEEANARILLQAAFAVQYGHREIHTVDTDEVVIAIMVTRSLQLN